MRDKMFMVEGSKFLKRLLALIASLAFVAASIAIWAASGKAWSATEDRTMDAEELSAITVRAYSSDVEATDQNGEMHVIPKGSEAVFRGRGPSFVRIQSRSSESCATEVSIKTEDGVEIEARSLFESGPWFRDISFSGTDKIAIVDAPSSPISLYATSKSPSEDQPEIGDVFSGKCTVTVVDQNGSGGSVNYVICSPSTGILRDVAGIRSYCADHSAAAPYEGQPFTYTFTVTSVNKKTGEVKGTFYASAVSGATDGVTTDSSGRLTGYQRVTITVILRRDYTGYLQIKKASSAPAMTSSNSLYSIDGATYRIYEDKDCTERSDYADLVTKEGEYVKSEAIAAGTYYLKETKAPKGFELSSKVYKVEVVANETVKVGVDIDGKTVVPEAPRHNPSKFVLAKLDAENGQGWAQGDSSLKGARYRMDYYEGQYSSIRIAEESGSPKKHWVFESDANGKINMSDESYLVSGSLYKDDDGDVLFPLGTYVIYELQPSRGYLLSEEKFHVQIIKDTGSDKTIFKGDFVKGASISGASSTYSTYANVLIAKEPPVKGAMDVEKADMDTGDTPQGDAELAETTFELRNRSKNAILYAGRKIGPNELICTLRTSKDGNEASVPTRSLPYGTYSLQETGASLGYRITDDSEHLFSITADGQIEHFKDERRFENEPQKGFASVRKRDRLSDDGDAQGDAKLEGTEFQIENVSSNAIFYDGLIYRPGEVIATIQTDEKGVCPDIELPYGTYSIKETKASEGFLLTDTSPKEFSIRNDGEHIELDFANDPKRGSLKLEKRDLETQELSPLGSAKLEGTKFQVTNRSRAKVVVSGQVCNPGELCATLYTNKSGLAVMAEKMLPYGTYSIKEVSPSEGYLLTDKEERTFTIREDGEVAFYGKEGVDGTIRKGDAFYNQVMREDLSLVKVRGDSGEHLRDIPFEIVSKTTGERHVLVSDENGEARTESSWNPHTRNTNANDTATEGEFDNRAGVWWGTNANGTPAIPDDALCALPYDTYTFRELPASANKRFELIEFEFTVERDGHVINLGTIENNPPAIVQKAAISTSATDSVDGDKLAFASSKCKLSDQVSYMNLDEGERYTLYASLLDAETLQLVPGAETTLEFVPESMFGSVVVELECDTLPVAGRDVVFFERLMLGDESVCEHQDAEDPAQKLTIVKPEVVTYAQDAHDGDKLVIADTGSRIKDSVNIENLEPGIPYTLYGIVIDASTNLPAIANRQGEGTQSDEISPTQNEIRSFWTGLIDLLTAEEQTMDSSYACDIPYSRKIDKAVLSAYLEENKEVAEAIDIVSKSFTPTSSSMTTTLDYPAPCSEIDGKYVIFDLLLNDDTVVAVHADTRNEDESFEMVRPEISTTATDKTDGDHQILPSREAKVVDLVEYKGLVSGEEYRLRGVLMSKRTGKELYVSDKAVEAEASFIPNSSSGSIELEFSFDSSSLEEGESLVVFEYLSKDGKGIAEHADMDDETQTVSLASLNIAQSVPDGGTYYKTGFAGEGVSKSMLALAIGSTSCLIAYRASRKRPSYLPVPWR